MLGQLEETMGQISPDPNTTILADPGGFFSIGGGGGASGPVVTTVGTPTTTTTTGGSGFWNAITQGLRSASGILTARFAVPQLNPGQLIQSGPGGTVMFQGGPNSSPILPGLPGGLGVGGLGIGTLLLVGGGLFLLTRKG
jgi:hypothetical protein